MSNRLRLLAAMLLVAWLATLVLAWHWGAQRARAARPSAVAPAPALDAGAGMDASSVEQLQQRVITLQRSDEISRSANVQLQETLAHRDEEIAALRADLAFYERLVGGSGPRQGLAVHDLDLERDTDGTWRYLITLTQNLNRGAVSRGSLTIQVEGVRDGNLATLDWSELLQNEQATPQDFAFRYFQQLEGSLMLPEGFIPRRLTVRLRAQGSGDVEQAFPWEASIDPEEEQT